MSRDDLQVAVAERARTLFERVRETTPSVFNRAWWSGKVMEWCMRNEAFKVEMFRFVDVLPYLQSSAAVARHLQEYFCRPDQCFPVALQWGIRNLSPDSMAAKLVAKGIRSNIVKMASQFITGATPEDALPNIKRIRKEGLAFTLDLLGEATLSWPEAEEYRKRYLDLLKTLVTEQDGWPALGEGAPRRDWGVSPRVNISLKPSSFNPRMHPASFAGSVERAREMIRPIFRAVREAGAFVNMDVEQHAFKDLTLSLFKSLMDEEEFRDFDQAGVVIQAYLRESERDARELIAWARGRSRPVTVRLVKGAYWDYETVVARQNGWRVPVFEDKAETDANFERVAGLILDNHDRVRLACASHNFRSIAFVREYATRLGIPVNEVEFQVLFGMAEPVKAALQEEKVPLRVYATVGELIPGMAYLVRRLLENTSNESFLRKSFADNLPIEKLIEDPRRRIPTPEAAPPPEAREDVPFFNEPHSNWAEPKPRQELAATLTTTRRALGGTRPLYIDGRFVETAARVESRAPADPDLLVASVCQAGPAEVARAIAAARAAFPGWRATSPQERARVLQKAAGLARRRRHELTALQIFEVGKTWTEADADVAEAIDFLEYYAREMIRLGAPRKLLSPPGELNRYFYQPRGLATVIAPWNFPLAISLGMTAAAIVAGNCVLYKPAGLSAAVGAGVAELFHEAGLPAGVLAYLPGPGATVGRLLVDSPEVSLIAFTGSREVGLDIIARAAVVAPGQDHIKRVIAELGGKNAIIVDADADLDEAVAGIIKYAFGFQGQKCSACSRVVVLDEIYDRFVARLVAGAESLVIGDPADPLTDVGPVIDGAAREKILGFVELGRREARTLLLREGPSRGSFAPLAIFGEVDPDSRLAQEEIFGPVLSVIKVGSIERAIEVANSVSYALTGGLYSRSPRNLELAQREFRVGNLYINRGITGAMVARQPFGGFKMSGVGSKAGGPDYLLQFLEPRCVTENTLRRGFAPAEEEGGTHP